MLGDKHHYCFRIVYFESLSILYGTLRKGVVMNWFTDLFGFVESTQSVKTQLTVDGEWMTSDDWMTYDI